MPSTILINSYNFPPPAAVTLPDLAVVTPVFDSEYGKGDHAEFDELVGIGLILTLIGVA